MKVLVANRGEIAVRILRTLREMGIASVAVHVKEEPHVWLADEVVAIDSFLSLDSILTAARRTGATAIHPGYGFLAQSAAFARACREAGIVFIGPTPEAMTALGNKAAARATAESLGLPVVPGGPDPRSVGFPLLIKASNGGGGKGMRIVRSEAELQEAIESSRREAKNAFGDDTLIFERYIHPARHVEVQILADGKDAVALGERECSLQRRYQKIIEEAPACIADPRPLFEAAVRLVRAVGYSNAGTVEFLVGPDGEFYFLEVNTRLQVEHPVTELLTGLDIVRLQIEIAHGGKLPAPPSPRGHAIEARLNAEDPYNLFLPQAGRVLKLDWPQRPWLRIDAGIVEGATVTTDYDPLLAKFIAWGSDREQARRRLIEALRETTLLGVITNQPFLIQILESDFFIRRETYTTTIESMTWTEPPVPEEVLQAAKRALAGRPEGPAEGGPSDRYSPWNTLRGFRP